MIWEQRTKAVIMLNRVIEKGSVSTLYASFISSQFYLNVFDAIVQVVIC